MEWKMISLLWTVHRVIWPDEEPWIWTLENPSQPLSSVYDPEKDEVHYGIDLTKAMEEIRSLTGLLEDETDRFLIALAAHEVRHIVVARGLVIPFTAANIHQLKNIMYPREEAERYVRIFFNFTSSRGNPEEGDAHLVEMLIFDALPFFSSLNEMRKIILLSPHPV